MSSADSTGPSGAIARRLGSGNLRWGGLNCSPSQFLSPRLLKAPSMILAPGRGAEFRSPIHPDLAAGWVLFRHAEASWTALAC